MEANANNIMQTLMLQMLMQQMGQQKPAAPAAPAEPRPREGNILRLCRTVNVFKRQDGTRVVGIGDIVCPWTGAARAIKGSACQKVEGKDYLRTKNEWDVTVSVSPLGRMRVVKAVDTGNEYVGGDDFDDDDDAPDGFGDAPVVDDGKETL